MTHDSDPEYLRRYYQHPRHCQGCEAAWVIERWTEIYKRRERDNALIDDGEARWRPLSALPLPFQDRAASLRESRFQAHDISLLRLTNIHTGEWVLACLLV